MIKCHAELAAAGKSVLLYDPVERDSAAPNLNIHINNDTVHTGTVLFDQYQSKVYGNTTVHNGTMQLAYGADTKPPRGSAPERALASDNIDPAEEKVVAMDESYEFSG